MTPKCATWILNWIHLGAMCLALSRDGASVSRPVSQTLLGGTPGPDFHKFRISFCSILDPFWHPFATHGFYFGTIRHSRSLLIQHGDQTTKVKNMGRRNSRRDNNPPPPARRGQGVPDQFANSDESAFRGQNLFSHLRHLFSIFFIFLAAQKVIYNQTSIKSFQNLKNRSPGFPKLDFGASPRSKVSTYARCLGLCFYKSWSV